MYSKWQKSKVEKEYCKQQIEKELTKENAYHAQQIYQMQLWARRVWRVIALKTQKKNEHLTTSLQLDYNSDLKELDRASWKGNSFGYL